MIRPIIYGIGNYKYKGIILKIRPVPPSITDSKQRFILGFCGHEGLCDLNWKPLPSSLSDENKSIIFDGRKLAPTIDALVSFVLKTVDKIST